MTTTPETSPIDIAALFARSGGFEPDLDRRVIARRPVDTGLLSILWQDGRGGLQVQGRDEVWREVPPRSDAFSVHCGDLLAGLSAGALRAPSTPGFGPR